MKKALEALVVVAALAVAAALAYQWRARRAADEDARVAGSPATHPGSDAAPGTAPVPLKPGERGVSSIPMVKMSAPPVARRRAGAVPPPPSK